MTAPSSLKYGKRDPKNAPALMFSTYKRPAAIAALPPVDYLSKVDWSGTMNGNDKAGDCVGCGSVNLVLLLSTLFTATGIRATLAEVLAIYKTQNPDFDINGTADTNGPGSSADGGMDEQTTLERWVKVGYTIGGQLIKAVAFAKVDHTNLAELRDAISIAGALMAGVQVAAAQQTQFPGVWDFDPNSPIEGGHCIDLGGHTNLAADDIKAVCWASEFGTTDTFLAKQLDEAWLVLFEWHLGSTRLVAGMDMATFASDFTAITGAQFPGPVTPEPSPEPAPAPNPVPDPAPAPVADQADLKLWSSEARSWVYDHKHHGRDADLASSLSGWALEKGLPTGEHVPEHAVG